MTRIFTALFLLLTSSYAVGTVDRTYLEGYLGEKKLDAYAERYQPLIFQDIYQGKMSFEDEIYFQNFFQPFLFQKENDYSFFLRSELGGAMICSNEQLGKHFDDIRFSYRLITLSYLLEGQWHMNLMSRHLGLKNGCEFDLSKWIKSCRPKSPEMKKFIGRLYKFSPRYDETLSHEYKLNKWWKEFSTHKFSWYSQYRVDSECQGKCTEQDIPNKFKQSCENDQRLMTLICSEMDEIYGLSQNRDAYFLLGLSNIINTYNKNGEAMGCLRRFTEVMSHKEVRYESLKQLFPPLQNFLRQRYQERFLQGRVFFYGASKEFEEKGLQDFYVKEQPIKIEKAPQKPKVAVKEPAKKVEVKEPVKTVEVTPVQEPVKTPIKEIPTPVKSAFLQAAEIRDADNLDRVEVDMLKLKYDYVFSLNMINTLSERLKTFMTREALVEMLSYDKLGSKEAPVPLLFIKYMIDMQEHHGLWNIIAVLGDRFYVSNEIDASFKPKPEFVQILNNEQTGRQWQLYIIRE